MTKEIHILSPCGMLGYGFPESSLLKGMEQKIHAIAVDAGSTDAGPHKLGKGVPIVSKRAAKKDLQLLVRYGLPRKIPIIIGSAGGAGAAVHVDWTVQILEEILKEENLEAKTAVISSDIPQEKVLKAIKEGTIAPLSKNIPALTEAGVLETSPIVAQMGHEPILEALKSGCDIIVCGRAYDPSPFAAVGIFYGKDPGLSYHLGKILECGALCAEPGSAKDAILGSIGEDSFSVRPLNPERKCTALSVAAHTFYEKEHPYLLKGPGFLLDLKDCIFKEKENGEVEVSGSRYLPDSVFKVKLEGARKTAYRSFAIAGIRDPVLLSRLEETEEQVKKLTAEYYAEIKEEDYNIRFYNYGKNGVMGEKEQAPFSGHEAGVLMETTASTQELASSILATVRSTFLHYGYPDRKSTAGNLAFPFAPSDVEAGPVYEFSIYHVMETEENLFSVKYSLMGGSDGASL
ncbi:DUF1446 domain-containing protein [Metabacillus sp. GX 13764]|uniref:acyclic terpene utilization AtuA family protein n=1 Tax=Metabacillus kandeliae TaxID=2900151 RepID=UPI001E519BFD|nr:acyclic terpene utilization AtuA family protein [Metabacillus kandeliae]MCD7035656.1 DUF1446 domain-containing protein [Metabacillus kandeliae]